MRELEPKQGVDCNESSSEESSEESSSGDSSSSEESSSSGESSSEEREERSSCDPWDEKCRIKLGGKDCPLLRELVRL